jgi:hypothetical protein
VRVILFQLLQSRERQGRNELSDELTFVDELQLRYNVKANVREFIFQHTQEHGQEVIYRPNLLVAVGWKGCLLLTHPCLR